MSDLPRAPTLVRRAVRSIHRYVAARGIRWAHVGDLFGLGHTSACDLCRACDVDPEEQVGPYEWERLEELLYGEAEGLDEEEWTRVTGEEPPPVDERYRGNEADTP